MGATPGTATPVDVVSDGIELRARIDEARSHALALADELAALTAAGDRGPHVFKVASDYQDARLLGRRLEALRHEVEP